MGETGLSRTYGRKKAVWGMGARETVGQGDGIKGREEGTGKIRLRDSTPLRKVNAPQKSSEPLIHEPSANHRESASYAAVFQHRDCAEPLTTLL